MPSAARISWAQLRVGIMAIVAMLVLAVLIFLLTGSGDLFATHAIIKTYMSDSAAMAQGSPVRLNGILIGSIDAVELTGLQDPKKIVEIRMKIKDKVLPQIPDDSQAEVTAANLLGDKFINITKGKSPTPIKDGGVLLAKEIQDIPDLISSAGNILGSFQKTLGRLDILLGDIEAGKGNIGKILRDEELYNRLNSTVAEAQKVIAQINSGKGTMGRLFYDETLYQDVRAPIKRLDDLLVEIQQGQGTAGKLIKDPAIYDEFRLTIAEFRKLVEELNSGKGTAGKILKDDQLYKQMNQLVAKLDSMLDRVNSGQGTLGQLLNNPQMYDSLNGATREMQSLMKDIRANPKKFLRIKLALF